MIAGRIVILYNIRYVNRVKTTIKFSLIYINLQETEFVHILESCNFHWMPFLEVKKCLNILAIFEPFIIIGFISYFAVDT